MSIDVSTELVIDRPIERVADYSANPDNAPKWYESIKAVEWKTAKPLKAGSRFVFTANFLGRTLVYTYEVVEFVPRELLVMRLGHPNRAVPSDARFSSLRVIAHRLHLPRVSWVCASC